jgi:hypothetical protein
MRKALMVLLLMAGLGPAAGSAATVAGVNVPDKADVAGQKLTLNGAGLRKKYFIKVYVGALYLPAVERSTAKILAADEARRMLLHFVYSVKAGQMCDAWTEGLADNTPNAGPEVKAAFKTLCGYMEDIPDGHELALTYLPGEGTRVEVNGKLKGTLPGKPTADAILSTWIGPKPGPGEDFKKAVLGIR